MDFLTPLKIQARNSGVASGRQILKANGEEIESYSPVDGKLIGVVQSADRKNYDEVIQKSAGSILVWRSWPAPKRGEVVRQNRRSAEKI